MVGAAAAALAAASEQFLVAPDRPLLADDGVAWGAARERPVPVR